MEFLAKRILQLSESATLLMTRKARELREQGYDIINLSIGEPDFNSPSQVKEAGKKAIDDNQTHYTPVAGLPELKKAIAAKLLEDNRLNYRPEQVVVSNGAKQCIANAMLCLVDPGDEVVIPSPYWVSYPEMAKLAGGKPVIVPARVEDEFKVTPQQVKKALTDRSKVFVFSSPCNPTGSCYSRDELKALAEVFAEHKSIFVISDEIYEYIIYDGAHTSIAEFDMIRDRVITVNGSSKGYAMTGWRLGYMAADEKLAKACDKLQGQTTSNASSISQLAMLEALRLRPDNSVEIRDMVHAFKQRRDQVISMLKQIPGLKINVPDGAFYVFPDVSEYFGKNNKGEVISNDADLSLYLLKEALVSVVPGSAFGDPNCIRISYATSMEKLKEAISRISAALGQLED